MEETVLNYLRTELLADPQIELSADEDLLGSGLINSMAIFRLIDFLEQTFAVRIPPEEMTIDHFMTVSAMCQYVTQRQAAARV